MGGKSSATISSYLQDLADMSSGFAVVAQIGGNDSVKTADGNEITAILISEGASWKNATKPT